MLDAQIKALQAYRIISRASNDAALMQAGANLASLMTGGLPLFHLAVDGFCLGYQMTIINDISDLYGKPRITQGAAVAYLRPHLGFILGNLALDKGLGVAVPVLGLPFCYIFARALTWRLGTFFTATAAMDADIPRPLLLEKLAGLVAELFPRRDFFGLANPDKEKFVALIAGLEGLSAAQAEARITTALAVLSGEYEILGDAGPEAEMAPEPETADLPEEILPLVIEAETGRSEDDDLPDAAAMEIPVPHLPDDPPAGAEAVEPDADSAPPADDPHLDPLPLAVSESGAETPEEDAEAADSDLVMEIGADTLAESEPEVTAALPAETTLPPVIQAAAAPARPKPAPAKPAASKKVVGRPKSAATAKK